MAVTMVIGNARRFPRRSLRRNVMAAVIARNSRSRYRPLSGRWSRIGLVLFVIAAGNVCRAA
jgi:ABC-type phosphate transport system permease subunit